MAKDRSIDQNAFDMLVNGKRGWERKQKELEGQLEEWRGDMKKYFHLKEIHGYTLYYHELLDRFNAMKTHHVTISIPKDASPAEIENTIAEKIQQITGTRPEKIYSK